MPTFNDSQPQGEIMPEGDYLLTVEGMEQGISRGIKTGGSDVYELQFSTPTGGRVKDNLIDAPSTLWKLDLFLKAAEVKIAKGDAWEFRQDLAARKACLWINPVGLKVWAHVVVEEYAKQDGSKGRSNKVAAYLLNKTLPAVPPVPQVAEGDDIPF